MTKADFDALPMLLKRKEVLAVTGWGKNTFHDKVKDGTLPAAKVIGSKRTYICKTYIAHMVGMG